MKRRLAGESRCKDAALRYYLLTEVGGEQAAVSGITTARQRVQGLLDGLIRGQVTPVALRDVVDDWLLA